MRLRQRVSNIRSEINETARQDQLPEQEPPKSHSSSSERPLMFEDVKPPPTGEEGQQNINEITSKYKEKIRSIIEKETSQ